jgi:hypothetical protein
MSAFSPESLVVTDGKMAVARRIPLSGLVQLLAPELL